MKNILFVSSEAMPFIKTGGLADVVGSLPLAIDKNYFDVRVMLPKYALNKYQDKNEYITNFYMDYEGRMVYVGLFKQNYHGLTYYFIDNEEFFNTPYVYSDDSEYEIRRYAFISKASLSALKVLDYHPDLIHCNDWQTGLIPVYLKDGFSEDYFYHDIKTVMTIHNLKFQGRYDIKRAQEITGLANYYFSSDKLEAYHDANLLKGGLVYSDALTTVSPSYAEEIKTPYYGEGLDGLLRARSNSLRGIVNGIDTTLFNPSTDSFINHCYDVKNFRKEKYKNKFALQKELNLEVNRKPLMIAIVSRLTDQKGFDLIACIIDEILANDNIQIVLLGTGDKRYEELFKEMEYRHPLKMRAIIAYSEEMAHKIYAGSDLFLMPSLFEPCGLSQLIALTYGTLPLVRETGGLKDTVLPYNEFEKSGNGFSFTNYNAHEMMKVLRYAEHIYFDKKIEWNKMIDRAMSIDYSWHNSALKYQEMYDWLIDNK